MPTDLEGMASCHTHATLCQFSHRIHGIHRSSWRKIFSHGFHRCSQMVRLRRVLWLLWEDSLVAAWVWQDAIPSRSVHICDICGRFLIGVLSGGAAVPAAPTKQSCTDITFLPQYHFKQHCFKQPCLKPICFVSLHT